MKNALVLCGTVPHTLLLEKLRQRGYHTILADWNPDAPARPFADEFVLESAFDKEAMLHVAKEKQAELVIASCSEQANAVCCYVAEQLGLTHPYSYETSLDVTDKGRMKTVFARGGVPTSAFAIFRNEEELRACEVPFPVVVKPVDAYSSKGVRKANTPEEMIEYGMAALALSRTGCGIVETYCPGVELQVDCAVVDGKAHVLMTRSKRTLAQEAVELNSGGSVVPADMTAEENAQAAEIAQRICDAFGLKNTPFFYQAMMQDGQIRVLEFAPRIGGGLSFKMVKRATGIDIVDLSIASFLEQPLPLPEEIRQVKRLSTLLLYMQPGVFGGVTGLEELIEEGIVDYGAVLKHTGDQVGPDRTSSNRAAMLLIAADTEEEMQEKIRLVRQRIDILDIDGVSRLDGGVM